MFKWIRNRKAQNTAEYAILIGIIVAAAVAMQTYVKRGLQGRVREAVDHVGSGGDVGGVNLSFSGQQFEPSYRATDYTVSQDTNVAETYELGGSMTRDSIQERVERTGTETITYDGE